MKVTSYGPADVPASHRAPLRRAQPLHPAVPSRRQLAPLERLRHCGGPASYAEMGHALTTYHQEPRKAVFEQMVDGTGGSLDYLRELVAEVHRDLWSVCAEGLGADTAKGVFKAALRDAMGVYPDLAIRCGLTRPLES